LPKRIEGCLRIAKSPNLLVYPTGVPLRFTPGGDFFVERLDWPRGITRKRKKAEEVYIPTFLKMIEPFCDGSSPPNELSDVM